MADLTDRELRDFAAGLRDELAPIVFESEVYQDRLAEIWSEETYDVDVSREIVAAVKAEWFLTSALSSTFRTFARIATSFRVYVAGSVEEEVREDE